MKLGRLIPIILKPVDEPSWTTGGIVEGRKLEFDIEYANGHGLNFGHDVVSRYVAMVIIPCFVDPWPMPSIGTSLVIVARGRVRWNGTCPLARNL